MVYTAGTSGSVKGKYATEGTQENGTKDKKSYPYAQILTSKRLHRQVKCVKKRKRKRIVQMHQYKDSRTTLERAKKDLSQQPVRVLVI